MQLPCAVLRVMERLEKNGFEAYAVGGCVRDDLLGITPHDWDVTTRATPDAVQKLFADERCVLTGADKGTVTVVTEEMPIEVTTYRTETTYRDHRHPDAVTFVRTIEEDLSRRDFTINAMAYHPKRGLVDRFGGQEDLRRRRLRCVGVARERFSEDALRILRALRFASTYDLSIEEKTEQALFRCSPLLTQVAPERLRVEWDRLLTGKAAERILLAYWSVLAPIFPEIVPMVGFEQHSVYHDRDVWQHTAAAVAGTVPDPLIRLTLLLHDCGKPSTFTMDAEGNGHFYSHAAMSEKMATAVLSRFRYDRETTEQVLKLIHYHDTILPTDPKGIKHFLSRHGEEFLRRLLAVKEGDCAGHAPSFIPERQEELRRIRRVLDEVIAEGDCFSLKDLAVNGDDVIRAGVPSGKQVGCLLQELLTAVIDGTVANERQELLFLLRKKLDN